MSVQFKEGIVSNQKSIRSKCVNCWDIPALSVIGCIYGKNLKNKIKVDINEFVERAVLQPTGHVLIISLVLDR